MKQIEGERKLLLIIFIIILIYSLISILFFFDNKEIDRSHRLPIFNENDEQIGIFEIYDIHPEGGHKTDQYLPLELTNLVLDNQGNYIQFSSHFIFNSTESNFSVEFFDNGDNQIGSEDHFIFYNYTEDV